MELPQRGAEYPAVPCTAAAFLYCQWQQYLQTAVLCMAQQDFKIVRYYIR
jgi:hypothetical protein